jgi:hypothetical protein
VQLADVILPEEYFGGRHARRDQVRKERRLGQ